MRWFQLADGQRGVDARTPSLRKVAAELRGVGGEERGSHSPNSDRLSHTSNWLSRKEMCIAASLIGLIQITYRYVQLHVVGLKPDLFEITTP